jgi:hypothetical protein
MLPAVLELEEAERMKRPFRVRWPRRYLPTLVTITTVSLAGAALCQRYVLGGGLVMLVGLLLGCILAPVFWCLLVRGGQPLKDDRRAGVAILFAACLAPLLMSGGAAADASYNFVQASMVRGCAEFAGLGEAQAGQAFSWKTGRCQVNRAWLRWAKNGGRGFHHVAIRAHVSSRQILNAVAGEVQ